MGWLPGQISRLNFSFDIPEGLAPRGFRETVSCKIRFSKNLDIKILRTKRLGVGTLGAPDRHCLDYDRAIYFAGQGWMSQGGCGKRWGCGRVSLRKSRHTRGVDGAPALPLGWLPGFVERPIFRA